MTQPQPQVPPPPDEGSLVTEAALAALEAGFAAAVLAAFTAWLNIVSTAVLAAFTRFGGAPDPSAIWSTIPAWERQVDALMDQLSDIARVGWTQTASQLGIDLPFDPTDPILADQLSRTRNLLVNIPNEIYADMLRALNEAVANGEGLDGQVRRINEILDVNGRENWPNRAKVISVTEVNRALHFGQLAAALRAQVKGRRVLSKTWITERDDRVRIEHRAALGQRVAVSQPFIVGGEALMAPGDPSGRASNVIACRCSLIISKGEADGR